LAANYLWLNPASANISVSSTGNQPKTVTSELINYRYGQVQLEVTATGGNIDSIVEKTATASRGYEQAFPYLNAAALKAQGSNFSNVSGATFSSEAYRQALNSALSKLG
jgi:uncharacterized protein with FMN-binding domain